MWILGLKGFKITSFGMFKPWILFSKILGYLLYVFVVIANIILYISAH